jgi:hypothetical protein
VTGLKRAAKWLLLISAGAMAVSAATAASDWNLTREDVARRFARS